VQSKGRERIMSPLLIGKAVETFGAILLAWPLGKAAYFQFQLSRHWKHERTAANKTLEQIRRHVDDVFEEKKMYFGTADAVVAVFGFLAFLSGCMIYLYGLTQFH
jgi:hypothetical protein